MNDFNDLHGRDDDESDAILEEVRRAYRHNRCECGGALVAQSGSAGLVVVRCAECDTLYAEVEL